MRQLSGHGLLHEGAPHRRMQDGSYVRVGWQGSGGPGHGVCRCGAASEELPSAGARRRWHREHKLFVKTGSTDRWAHPQLVSDVKLAFPAVAEGDPLLPDLKDIPADYPNRARWLLFQQEWFFNSKFGGVYPIDGVDPMEAYRHLAVLQGTFGISHQHKEAAVAWLLSQWFRLDKEKAA